MNTVEFSRIQVKLAGDHPHVMFSRAYGVWFCMAHTCIGQGTTKEEAFSHWERIDAAQHSGRRHL